MLAPGFIEFCKIAPPMIINQYFLKNINVLCGLGPTHSCSTLHRLVQAEVKCQGMEGRKRSFPWCKERLVRRKLENSQLSLSLGSASAL